LNQKEWTDLEFGGVTDKGGSTKKAVVKQQKKVCQKLAEKKRRERVLRFYARYLGSVTPKNPSFTGL